LGFCLCNARGALHLIVFAIPFFFLLIGLELVIARRRKLDVYRFSDSITDLSCGVVNQVLVVLIALFNIAVYSWLSKHTAIFAIDDRSPLMWMLCFLGVDFFYYWFHRLSHQINFMWAVHVVHHQSEDYNLAVALRQPAIQPLFSGPFYLPLAVIGFPLPMFLTLAALNTLYQFWIHTRLIDRMGPLEHIINTPSHHRVHHGQNPKYIDKNHGGTLIIWDKLFGTFQREDEEPVYGVTEPLESWNPLFANLHTWLVTLETAKSFDRFSDRVKIWFKGPGWVPPALERDWVWAPAEKYDPKIDRGVAYYVLAHFTLCVVATVAYLLIVKDAPLAVSATLGIGIVITLVALGGLLEKKSWARRLEMVRIPAVLMLAVLLRFR
jgi:alkylglycerol monooxygenase